MSFRLAFLLLFVALFFGGQPASGQTSSSSSSPEPSSSSPEPDAIATSSSPDDTTVTTTTVTTTTVTTTTAQMFTQNVTMAFTADENFTLNESAFVSSLDLGSNVEAEIIAKFEVKLTLDTNKTAVELSTYYGADVTFVNRRLLGRSLSTEQKLTVTFDINNENATDIKGKIANPDSDIGTVEEAPVYKVSIEIILKKPAGAGGSKPTGIPNADDLKGKLAAASGEYATNVNSADVSTTDSSSGSGSGGDVDAKSYHMDAVSGLLVAMIGGLVVQIGQWA